MNAAGDATGKLVLATLFLAPTEEREAELRRAARAEVDWPAALVALEAHGILGLAFRNLERAGAALPLDVSRRLKERAAAMRAIELGFRLTLERFLDETQRAGVEVTLLKGASLALDLFSEPGLRSQGDIDVLVRPEHALRAIAAARRIGLDLAPRALPAWWYRLAHFHVKLVPGDGLQRELELHWHLHPLAQLYTVRLADLHARRRPLVLAGLRAWTLDPLDRLLHLVTHLTRHCPLGMLEHETLLAWAIDPRVPLRLKWLLDVRAEIEHRHAELAPAELARRAVEWNAESELAAVLAWVRERLGFAGGAQAWVEQVLAAMPPVRSARPGSPPARDRALPALDLRLSALLAFPRWVLPPRAYFGRLSGTGPVTVARRVRHAAGVLLHGTLVLGATPLAWLASLAVRASGRKPVRTLGADELLALAARARQLARAEERSTAT